MNVFIAIILGIIQGLTEFLPVSSSGHLLLFQNIFGLGDVPRFFDVMLHIGTLAAVFVVFWKDIVDIIKHPIQKLPVMIVVATIPTVIIAVIFEKLLDSAFSGAYLGYGFMLTGILLYAMEYFPKKKGTKTLENMTWKDAVTVGVAQGIGVLPGVSRSGITIAGGVFVGMKREFLAKFSFLMSIPAILGALALDSYNLISEKKAIDIGALPIIFGTIAAGITGFFAVKFMLQLIAKKSFKPIAVYVFVLGFLVSLDMFLFHVVF